MNHQRQVPSQVSRHSFGTLPDGRGVRLFALTNRQGATVSITNFGGTITSIKAPDRNGVFDDIVRGLGGLNAYLAGHPFFGSTIGRYANRIAGGVFDLDGETHRLARNNGPNHLHGGATGFDQMLWNAEVHHSRGQLRLNHTSADGDGGYPGRLEVTVTFSLTDADELRIDYRAVTDKPTHVNLTNHSYFNLAGSSSGSILDHEVTIDADHFTPTDAQMIPTGELRSVAGTPMDFRRPTTIGSRIDDDDRQLLAAGGYDQTWVLNPTRTIDRPAARVVEPDSGRVLEVLTTEPGVQFYTANFLDGSHRGPTGRPHGRRCAYCLETQHFPNTPNRPEFPSTVLRPGEVYHSTTIYRFSVTA